MKQNGRVNALLVELLIVVLFFMLASTTLIEIFAAAKHASNRADVCSSAMLQAQNMAESLYAADDAQDKLLALGFEQQENAWYMDCGSYALHATCEEEATAAGTLRQMEITAHYGEETLFTLPVDRYFAGEVQP